MRYSKDAERRGISFDLTYDQFLALSFLHQCAYCGEPACVLGIDRLDNTIGYILSNCRPCCSACSSAKLDRTAAEFISHAIRIAQHQQRTDTQ